MTLLSAPKQTAKMTCAQLQSIESRYPRQLYDLAATRQWLNLVDSCDVGPDGLSAGYVSGALAAGLWETCAAVAVLCSAAVCSLLSSSLRRSWQTSLTCYSFKHKSITCSACDSDIHQWMDFKLRTTLMFLRHIEMSVTVADLYSSHANRIQQLWLRHKHTWWF